MLNGKAHISTIFKRLQSFSIPLLIAVLIGVNAVVLTKFTTASTQLSEQRTATVETKTQLTQASKKLSDISEENKNTNSALTDTRSKMVQLQQENDELKAKKQAKLAAEAEAAKVQEAVVTYTAPTPKITSYPAGHAACVAWLAATVSPSDLDAAVEIQGRENMSCNPQQYNTGGSDACGVAQELPCGKSGCGIPPNADGACQIRWMNSYVIGRYGSWAAALAHHNAVGWY